MKSAMVAGPCGAPNVIASGKRSNSATATTAPAEKPRMRCSRSRKRIAKKPPNMVAANAMATMTRSSAIMPATAGETRYRSLATRIVGRFAGHDDVVDMAFAQARAGDAHEFGALVKIGDGLA